MSEPVIYRVPEENLAKLTARIEKLDRRAKKLGAGSVSLAVLGSEDIETRDEDGFRHIRTIHLVSVSGAAPKLNGWQFVAVIQPVVGEDGTALGNILRVVPGTEGAIPEKYRSAENFCDHCQTNRRRNETFVLRSEIGTEYKQVGRNCLRDFLGHSSPESYAEMAQILLDAADFASDSERSGTSSVRERFVAEEILQLAAASIRLNGWRSNKVAREFGGQSTSGLVSEWLFGGKAARENFKFPLVPDEADKATATEVLSWLAELSSRDTSDNDFMYNLSLLGRGATFTARNFGLACAAIPTFAKEKEREINRKKRFESDANSNFIGVVGERFTFTATVVYSTVFESDFGTTHFYKMKDTDGNVIVYFASRIIAIGSKDLVTGMTVSLVGGVKKHEVREGVKQTVVTRCKPALSKKTEKAIKILAHAAAKGVFGGLAEEMHCEGSANYNHNYDPRFCKAPHAISWSNSAFVTGDDWIAGKHASDDISKLICELEEEAIVSETETKEAA